MILILLGPPGAGKGTQADIISRKLSIPTISTGNILRRAIENRTPVGCIAQEYMSSGELVPDEVVIDIVKERLNEPDCRNGCILDGMPRTIAQAEALEHVGVDIDTALLIEISDEEIKTRMTGRRVCSECGTTFHILTNPPANENVCDVCGGKLIIREDDEPETVAKRLKVYHEETEPLIDFFKSRGKLKSVKNQSTIKATTEVIFDALGI